MSKSADVQKLTFVDWFTIITGSFGFVANIVALATLFINTRKPETITSQKSGITSGVWILIFFTIVYTTCLISIFSRRLFSSRHKRRRGVLSKQSRERIEIGAGAVTVIYGGMFLLIFVISGALASDFPVFGAIIYGGPIGLLFSIGLNFLAMYIYSAFDEGYWADWSGENDKHTESHGK